MLTVNKIQCIKRYQFSQHHVWKQCFRNFLKDKGIVLEILLKGNYDLATLKLKNHIPNFYLEMLRH
jgi:hypothetical protein